MKKWSTYEEKYLRSIYTQYTNKEIAQIMHRTHPSIYCKAWRLGLQKH